MSAIQTYFQDFLTNIRLPDSLKKALISAHTELREQLKSDDLTKDLLVESFLQGSYARSTCIKPAPGKKVDVDVIVVTNIDHDTVSAQEAFAIITPFVKKYYQNYEQQKRSIGISLPEVDMDLVITAAPSEEVKRAIECAGLSSAFTVDDLSGYQQSLLENYRLDSLERFFESDSTGQQWRAEPLLIPDNVENQWYRTHPLKRSNGGDDWNYLASSIRKAIRWNILWESVVQMESQVLQRASSEPWSALRNVILKSHSSQTGGFLSMTYLRCSQMRIMTLSIRRFAAVQDLLEQLMIALI